jgi:hypothetical protein
MAKFVTVNSGCPDGSLPCWGLMMSGMGYYSGASTDASLVSEDTVLVDPSWNKPTLLFSHLLNSNAFSARLNIGNKGSWRTLKEYATTGGAWRDEVVDLTLFKGKSIQIGYFSSLAKVGTNMKINWLIQNVKIVPEYTP